MRAALTEIINKSLSGSRTKTPRLCAHTKPILIRFPHLHTIKLCSGPLRRRMTGWKTYEGLWIALTNKGRKLISLEQSAGCLLVVPTCPPHFSERHRQAGSEEIGKPQAFPACSEHAASMARHDKWKWVFSVQKKTDNVAQKEKRSLFWWETAGGLPIRCWIYIISEICCWR